MRLRVALVIAVATILKMTKRRRRIQTGDAVRMWPPYDIPRLENKTGTVVGRCTDGKYIVFVQGLGFNRFWRGWIKLL